MDRRAGEAVSGSRPSEWSQAILRLEAERAERARLAPGTTKEVLGFIIDFLAFNLGFLGFPIIVLGFPRISIGILSGF